MTTPETCPACGAKREFTWSSPGAGQVRYRCGAVVTERKSPHFGDEWKITVRCERADSVALAHD